MVLNVNKQGTVDRSFIVKIEDKKSNQTAADEIKEYATVKHVNKNMNFVNVECSLQEAEEIENLPFVDYVEQDQRMKAIDEDITTDSFSAYANADEAADHINVKQLWDSGYHGEGMKIAIIEIDGVDNTHEALDGNKIAYTQSLGFDNAINEQGGHGTATAYCAAGKNIDSTHRGIAYEADVYYYETDNLSQIWQAMDDAISQNVDVCSISLRSENPEACGDGSSAQDAMIEAFNSDMFTVAGAGNWGDDSTSTDGSGVINFEEGVAVGATDGDLNAEGYSSRGPVCTDTTYPTVCAAGNRYVADADTDSGYAATTGTSFACPSLAGAVALIRQKRPDMHPDQIKEALKATASNTDSPDNNVGWGTARAYEASEYKRSKANFKKSGSNINISPSKSGKMTITGS